MTQIDNKISDEKRLKDEFGKQIWRIHLQCSSNRSVCEDIGMQKTSMSGSCRCEYMYLVVHLEDRCSCDDDHIIECSCH